MLKDGEVWADGRVACCEGLVPEADECPRPLRGYRHIHSHSLRTKQSLLQTAVSDAACQDQEGEEEEEEGEISYINTASKGL